MRNLILILIIGLISCNGDLPENSDRVESVLYLGKNPGQPLIVGLGGSEGGNAWTSDRWNKTRNQFINQGYAFLAVEYFGGKNTPGSLDRISIDAVHKEIIEASQNSLIDKNKITIIGGSKGAELALLLASHYKDISCVVAMVPGNCAFPALTISSSTSSWMYNGKEVPYVPMPWAAVPSAIKHDLRSAFQIMLEDREAVQKALIKVEDIKGPVLLISATKDEMWPSTEMSNEMMERFKQKNFSFTYEHLAVIGAHSDVLDHFDRVFEFLDLNFKNK